MTPSQYPALVLNADYKPLSFYPLSLRGWQESVTSVMGGRVDVVEEYDRTIRSAGSERVPMFEMRLPSVIALRHFQRQDRAAPLTRIGILIRDRRRCMYCNTALGRHDLTFDHVVPRCKGGLTTWQNVVASCSECNLKKGKKPLVQSGLRLVKQPWVPSKAQLNHIASGFPMSTGNLHPSWVSYLGIAGEGRGETRVTTGAVSQDAAFPDSMSDMDYWSVEIQMM